MLPQNLTKESIVAIIAGRGKYPVFCAKNIELAGCRFVVVAVDDEVDSEWFDSLPSGIKATVSVGQLGKLLAWLKKSGAQFAIMAGQVKPKKLFHGLWPDVKAMVLLASLKERHAESIFGAIAAEIEKLDIKMLDARTFMEDSLATHGPMSCKKCSVNHDELEFGINIAREVARLNIGQSVVVRKGTVVAVEDFAGTDNLIERVKNFNISDAIFVKTAKVHQDFRFDVPVFGERTLEHLRDAKIKYAALEAGSVLILDKPGVIAKARDYGIEIIGF